jgi:hypothetical protein
MSPTGKTPANDTSAADSFNQICTVRIELLDTNPLIWREVEVPTSITLKVLHDIVQITMGWLDQHLWEFTINGQTYGLPMDEDWGTAPRTEANKVRLRDVLKPRQTRIDYLYDFGDSWEHRITVTKIRPGTPGVSYPTISAANGTARPRTAAASQATTICSTPLLIPSIPTTPKSLNTSRTGTPRRSTNSRSGSPSAASPIAEMPHAPGSQKRPADHVPQSDSLSAVVLTEWIRPISSATW